MRNFIFFKKRNEDRYRRMFYEAGIYENVSAYPVKYVSDNIGIETYIIQKYAEKNKGFLGDSNLIITRECFKELVKDLMLKKQKGRQF